MPVVFEEVIANIETPPPPAREQEVTPANRVVEQDEMKMLQLLEIRLRRQQRLEAD